MVLNFLIIREAPSSEAFYGSMGRCQAVEQTNHKYHYYFPGHFIFSSRLWLPFSFLSFFFKLILFWYYECHTYFCYYFWLDYLLEAPLFPSSFCFYYASHIIIPINVHPILR